MVTAPTLKTRWLERGILVACFVALNGATFACSAPVFVALVTLAAAALAAAVTRGHAAAAHAAFLTTAYIVTLNLGLQWPLPLVLILAAYAACLLAPAVRRSAGALRRGRIDRPTALWMLAFIVTAGVALVLWRFGMQPDMDAYAGFVPAGVATWMVFAGIVPYAMLNAAVEELLWRGVLWEAAEPWLGRLGTAVLTSASFGLAHYHGFPSGVVGVALATIYGGMMAVMRWRTAGLFWPWVAHIFADIVIFSMIAAMVVLG
jgi:hypothetical protein